MKLVVDLQGAQTTGNKNRGIGRYSLALLEAMLRKAGDHEIWIALDSAFSDTIEPLAQIRPFAAAETHRGLGRAHSSGRSRTSR